MLTGVAVVQPEPFHLFDFQYMLLGFNWQMPCGSTALELELSTARVIGSQLWWVDAYASGGFQNYRRDQGECTIEIQADPDEKSLEKNKLWRAGGGLGIGWRFLALDTGLLHNSAFRHGTGWRVRGGIALASEFFSGGSASFSRACCPPDRSEPCECRRTPVGLSLFLYYAHEYYWGSEEGDLHYERRPDPVDGMFGLSFKVGFGL